MNVCPDCFNEGSLKKRILQIRPTKGQGFCQFHPNKKGVPIEDIAQLVDPVFRAFFILGDDVPYFLGDTDQVQFEQNGESLANCIESLTDATSYLICETLAQELINIDPYDPRDGAEQFYSHDLKYNWQEDEYDARTGEWRSFCDRITHHLRFFDENTAPVLDSIFNNIDTLKGAVHTLKKGKIFYRARLAQNSDDARIILSIPQRELSVPPKRKRRANRLNPSGIGCFYGANHVETSIAEIRPSVNQIVVVGEFELMRDINVFDTTKFKSPPTYKYFQQDAAEKRKLHLFMQTFMREISKPTQSGDEHLDYIPTQVIAEYFTNKFTSVDKGKIEGIIYNSAQMNGGTNIALLGDAAYSPQNIIDEYNDNELSKFFKVKKKELTESEVKNCGINYLQNSAKPIKITEAKFESKKEVMSINEKKNVKIINDPTIGDII